jgi:hypothetical protein
VKIDEGKTPKFRAFLNGNRENSCLSAAFFRPLIGALIFVHPLIFTPIALIAGFAFADRFLLIVDQAVGGIQLYTALLDAGVNLDGTIRPNEIFRAVTTPVYADPAVLTVPLLAGIGLASPYKQQETATSEGGKKGRESIHEDIFLGKTKHLLTKMPFLSGLFQFWSIKTTKGILPLKTIHILKHATREGISRFQADQVLFEGGSPYLFFSKSSSPHE